MSDYLFRFFRLLLLFLRSSFFSLASPYTFYRRLAREESLWPTAFFPVFLSATYFLFASLIRTGMRNPYLLTLKFNRLFFSFLLGFLGMIFLFRISAWMLKRENSAKPLFTLWSYSLLPTLSWFFLTSFLYLFFPPPRTVSFLGKLYTFFYLSFSFAVLFWKMILYYLTLRFGLRIDFFKIFFVSLFLLPFVSFYSLICYRLGIFRVPFL